MDVLRPPYSAQARAPTGNGAGGHDAFLMDDPHYHGALRAYFGNIEL